MYPLHFSIPTFLLKPKTFQVATQEHPQRVTEAETKKMEARTGSRILTDEANSDANILINRLKCRRREYHVQNYSQ